jgi:hypothetical protein
VVSDERVKKLTANLLRTATVMQIEQDALEAAAKALKRKRAIMVVPQRSLRRVQSYLVWRAQRCLSYH